MTTYLVVADLSRTNKTICLAVTPALKELGVSGRPRLFEVEQQVKYLNGLRCLGKSLQGKATDKESLAQHPDWAVSYLVAAPRMARYLEISSKIYGIYLQFLAPEDIHVYSIDEVFIDLAPYKSLYKESPRELAGNVVQQILKETGITATVGIGSNLYLAKIAMDMVAKKLPGDKNGMRVAELDETDYRRLLWNHRPLTDFWRIGHGYEGKLSRLGLYTMGDVARCSLGNSSNYYNQELLYKLFGVNAELLIDHAWGYEPCSLKEIKGYIPENNSISVGQVLPEPYYYEKGHLIVLEMGDALSLELVARRLNTEAVSLTIGYDVINMKQEQQYLGKVGLDHYGRTRPYHAHGTIRLGIYTNSSLRIRRALEELYEKITDKELLIRRINITALKVKNSTELSQGKLYEQMELFSEAEPESDERLLDKEENLQKAMLEIADVYGKNAILRGMNLLDGGRTKERNEQIGGHKA